MGLFFDPKPERSQVWSDGGGTQSCCIAALICGGLLPKPDYAVIVKTKREVASTFEYHERYVFPALAKAGVTLHVIAQEEYATVDLTSKNGNSVLIPAFTNLSGEVGKLPTYCSGEWKRDAISRWMREQGIEQCDMWMGFSLDEMSTRVGKDRRKWIRKIYPLIDLRMNRQACIAHVLKFGWPTPPRSRCWICPNQCRSDWKAMRDHQPEEFAKAVAFERDELWPLDANMFLHESCKPLNQVDFDDAGETSLRSDCDSGLCFV